MSGVITLSIEIELAWGNHDTGEHGRLSAGGVAEREYLSKLLSVADASSVPISFDVVGHLFLDGCPGAHDGPHSDGWFRADPGTDYQTDGLFYAPDMITDITSASVSHEICTHTFSHILFDEVSATVADWELRHVQQLHREHLGEETKSLVPPRHRSPEYDVLLDNGIDVVRPGLKNRARSGPHRFKELLVGPLPLSHLRKNGGLVETTCTTNPSLTAPALASGQGETHALFRPIPVSIRRQLHLRKLQRATRTAAEEDGHLHLWCHLFDLSNEDQFHIVRAYLEWLGPFVENRDLTVATMDELPQHV